MSAVAWDVGTSEGAWVLTGLPDPAGQGGGGDSERLRPLLRTSTSGGTRGISPSRPPLASASLRLEGVGPAQGFPTWMSGWASGDFFERSSVQRRLLFLISISEEIMNPFPKEKKREPLVSVAAPSTEGR